MSVKTLIVDDSEHTRTAIRLAVENHSGWMVCGEAENGKIGIAMVQALNPDLVILDLSMPVMNGLDAARGISAISPGMPIVMFTMYQTPSLLAEAQKVGITHVFSKYHGLGDREFESMRTMLTISAIQTQGHPTS